MMLRNLIFFLFILFHFTNWSQIQKDTIVLQDSIGILIVTKNCTPSAKSMYATGQMTIPQLVIDEALREGVYKDQVFIKIEFDSTGNVTHINTIRKGKIESFNQLAASYCIALEEKLKKINKPFSYANESNVNLTFKLKLSIQ